MPNTLRYPLHSLSPETLRDLQEKYPNASVQIELNEYPAEGGLSEEAFWALIGLLDWSQQGRDDAIIEPVVIALAEGPLRHIYDFKDILSQKLYLIDTAAHARNIGASALGKSEAFSDDGFLFARCCAVANGQELYERARKYPEHMPKDLEFAPLLRIAGEAYKRQKGRIFQYVAAYPIETGSNQYF